MPVLDTIDDSPAASAQETDFTPLTLGEPTARRSSSHARATLSCTVYPLTPSLIVPSAAWGTEYQAGQPTIRLYGRFAFGAFGQTARPCARPAVSLGEERKSAGRPAALVPLVIRVLLKAAVDPSSVDQRHRVARGVVGVGDPRRRPGLEARRRLRGGTRTRFVGRITGTRLVRGRHQHAAQGRPRVRQRFC